MRVVPLLLLLTSTASALRAQTPMPIRPGDTAVERVVSPGKPHTYSLSLGARYFVRGSANQLTADIVVRVLDPDGRVIGTFDGPARGPEPFRFTTRVAGVHLIEISAFENDSGAYTLRLDRAEPIATQPEARVDQLMSDYDRSSPGGVVAVVQNGKVSFVRGYGMANLEDDVPNGPETIFHMGSVSKQFTAFAVLLLAEQGKLALDDDIRKYLPEMADFGMPITIRHLIHHTSGLRDQWALWQMAGGRMDDVITQSDLLALVFRQNELNFTPGSEYLYSNTGYMLLSEIVARVTGEPFGAWLKRTVFDPLGMTHTQIYDDHQRLVKRRAYSYQRGRDGQWAKAVLSYANWGATGLFTTAGDLALWLANYRSGKVGGSAVIARMRERGRLNNGDSIPYAFGIVHSEHRGLQVLEHGGADAGYRTMLAYYPELDAGVIALGNDAGFEAAGIARGTAEAFFADRMTAADASRPPGTSQTGATPAPWRPSPVELQAFVGTYYSPELETQYVVLLKDSALIVRHRRHGDLALRPADHDRFVAQFLAPGQAATGYVSGLQFERAADGRVTGMRVSSDGVRRLLFERFP